eukprot:13668948-Ditylum_brightwellii.AAC.1
MLTDSIKPLTQKVEMSNKKKLPQTPRPTSTVDWDQIAKKWAIKKVQPDQTLWGGSDRNKDWNG